MSSSDDKRELLKLKQGLIEDSESEILSEEKPNTYEKPRGKAAVANFFYHYKFIVLVVAFFTFVAGFLIIDTLSRDKEDIRIVTIATNEDASSALYLRMYDIEEAFELYTPDFDGNGYVHVENYYISLDESSSSYDAYQGNIVKLYGEIQDGTALIFMGDRAAFETIAGEGQAALEYYFHDLSEMYPDNPDIVDGIFYKVKDTTFAFSANMISTCPDDMYIAIRKNLGAASISADKAAENLERALEVFDNIVNDNKLTVD